jgi:nucleoside-diphosphate-sugar epimerase
MNVGIVGGNSQVATELAILFRADGHDVYPIVRNRQGAAFLGYHGFECRIADPSQGADLRDALKGVDVVLVSAYAGIGSRSIDDFKQAWRVNNAIVGNSVRESPGDATVFHFSSVAAFGNELFRSVLKGRFDQYAVSKRHLERLTLRAARKASKDAYSFRLGHVLGPSQSMAKKLVSPMRENDHLIVGCDPDAEANVVHTVTIKDAIEVCIGEGVPNGRYTVVNRPQWTWRRTLEHYAPSFAELEFTGGPETSSRVGRARERLLSNALGVFVENRMRLLPLQLLVPDWINDRIVYEYKKWDSIARVSAGGFGEPQRYYTHEFSYEPVDGPFLDGLERTEELLEAETAIEDSFSGGSSPTV